MRLGARQLVAAVYSLTMVLPLAWGESFYLRRDHRDQGVYTEVHEYKVKSMEEAEVQLEKYGYIKDCHFRRARRNTVASGLFNIRELDDTKRDDCSKEKVRKSLMTYQKRFGLPQTGKFDVATQKLMNRGRCGNRDDGDIVKAKVTEQTTLSTDATQTTPAAVSAKIRTRRSAEFVQMPREATSSERTDSIFKKLFPQASQTPLKRRRKLLNQIIEELKSGKPSDTIARNKRDLVRIRKKRSSVDTKRRGEIFQKNIVRWRLLEKRFSTKMPIYDQIGILRLAFRMWSEVIPLHFILDGTSDISEIDIEISFRKGAHFGCDHAFDGTGGELAHSWVTGDIHFDDDENFAANSAGISLLKIAVHEIGHVLGLGHLTERNYSIMFPLYERDSGNEGDFEIGWEDRKYIQGFYGSCRGRFDTIFDWVRKLPDNTMVFNSYFFRDGIYWMYENNANRTRYGDPLGVSNNWRGLPDKIDGYAHVYIPSHIEQDTINNQYFFSGEDYYLYNSVKDKVEAGWPRKIADEFGPKNGTTERIPDNIDTVYFDFRDQNYYFFKGSWVYVFKPKSGGCCERKRKITEEFPALNHGDDLPDNLDAVYFSFKDTSVYFVKGEDTFKNVYFGFDNTISNGVRRVGKWWDQWYDICEV